MRVLSSWLSVVLTKDKLKPIRLTQKLRYLASDRAGAMVDMALALPIFFLLIFGVIEFSHLSYAKLNIDNALQQACRYMITGQGQDLTTPIDPLQRRNTIEQKFCQNLIVAGLSCSGIDSHFSWSCVPTATSPTCPIGVTSCAAACNPATTGGAGLPGQTVTVTVNFTKGWMTTFFSGWLSGIVNLSSKATWKNELYQ